MVLKTLSIKLLPNRAQEIKFQELSDSFSKACNACVSTVIEHKCWNNLELHHRMYYVLRKQFPGLGSQLVVQAIKRVCTMYKSLKSNKRIKKDKPIPKVVFKPTSVHYDKRTYTLKPSGFSFYTIHGRITVPYKLGEYQRLLMESGSIREGDLVSRKGQWYFNLVIEIPESIPVSSQDVLGVDIGENNLAAISNGKIYGGARLRHNRQLYLATRKRLQANGSRRSKRKLKQISGKESRHVKHVNHVISKDIVREALKGNYGSIRLEDLTNIRDRIKANKRVRSRLHSWAFRQLQEFITYKALALGINVSYINPAYTSQTCSTCGNLGDRSKHSFYCPACKAYMHADVNASKNIRLGVPSGHHRASVNKPLYSRALTAKSSAL